MHTLWFAITLKNTSLVNDVIDRMAANDRIALT